MTRDQDRRLARKLIRWSVVIAAALWAPTLARAADPAPPQIIAALNSQRAANGLPAVTETSQWSAACAAHDLYMEHNDAITHTETPGAPDNTQLGAWAGTSAVLAGSQTWTHGDPWLNAPIHLGQVMSPELQAVGAAELNGYDCLTTWPGYNRGLSSAADRLYSFPGNGGAAPYSQAAFEAPFTPGQWLGLPPVATTGPYLFVYWVGPAQGAPLSLLSAATVTGPDGPVQVGVLNSGTSSSSFGGLGGYLAPNSGMILPLHPLRPDRTYTVSATFSTDQSADQGASPRSWAGSFSFRTTHQRLAGDPAPYQGAGFLLTRLQVPRRIAYRRARSGIAITVRLPIAAHLQALLRDRHGLIATASAASSRPGTVRLVLKTDPITLVNAFGRGKTATLGVTIEGYDNSTNDIVTKTLTMTGV